MPVHGFAPDCTPIMVTVPPPRKPADRKPIPAELRNLHIPSVYGRYPNRKHSDVMRRIAAVPAKLNPTKPKPPYLLTVAKETGDEHFQNAKRHDALEQLEYDWCHKAWSRYIYGTPIEKEIYRRAIREGLKEQMKDLDAATKHGARSRVQESTIAAQIDFEDLDKDAHQQVEKRRFLLQYRDANKTLMEQTEVRRAQMAKEEVVEDRKRLDLNPINWSCTLT